jgi:hypothetical protein
VVDVIGWRACDVGLVADGFGRRGGVKGFWRKGVSDEVYHSSSKCQMDFVMVGDIIIWF